MKKTLGILFAFAMILSIVFIGDAVSSNGSMSAQAQEGTVRRRRTGGVVGGTRYAAHKTKRAGKYVAHKTVRGTVLVGKTTVQGTKYAAHKTKRGAKAFTSRTKKIILGDN